MDFKLLFDTQRELDNRILDRFPELRNEDLLDKKILALQVELGELAQNWRGFKFWSEDQEPRTWYERECHACNGQGGFTHTDEYQRATEPFEECLYCEGTGFEEQKNPLLEEYVDCLHFILSIGNELGYQNVIPSDYLHRVDNTTKQFNYVFYAVMSIDERIECNDYEDMKECYGYLFGGFIELGKQLGFTRQQIEQAYFDKNKINHERQSNGY